MGVFTYQHEYVSSTVAPARLYKALTKTKVVEHVEVTGTTVEIVEGNGGPGTIKKVTIVEDSRTTDILHKVEAIDEANLGYNYSIVGGTGLDASLEKVSFETKLLPGPGGRGSVKKVTVKYHTKGNAGPSEEVRKVIKKKKTAHFKAIDSHVLANPHHH